MGVRDLCQKYRRFKSAQAINRAIRAELPGGAAVLDLLDRTYRLSQTKPYPEYREFFEKLQSARDEMKMAIAEKYDFVDELAKTTEESDER